MIIHRILALVIKEFLQVLKDPRSRTVVFVPPIVQTFLFGYAATFDLVDVPYAVWDEDRSASSRELLSSIDASSNFRCIGHLSHYEELEEAITSSRVRVVVHVGPRFERDVRTGRTASLQVIADGRNSNSALIAVSYISAMVQRFNARRVAEAGARPPPVELEVRSWFNPNLESRWFIVSGLPGLLTFIVTVLITSLSVAREREQGTFDQLLVTPYRPVEILVGKAAPGFCIGLFEATFITLVAVHWFGVPLRGNLLTLYAGIVVFLFSAVGFGLMISSLSVTMQQGLLGAFLFVVPSVILSGFATPISSMAKPVQWITYLNPLRYLMSTLRSVFLEGTPLLHLLGELWPMALIGIVTLTAAGWLFRHRLY
jgi:ABC-2 type transport system permease protein